MEPNTLHALSILAVERELKHEREECEQHAAVRPVVYRKGLEGRSPP